MELEYKDQPFNEEVGHCDPYNLFDELVNVNEGIKESSPKMKKFSELPKERQFWFLEDVNWSYTPSLMDEFNFEANKELYQQSIYPSDNVYDILDALDSYKLCINHDHDYKTSRNLIQYPFDAVICEKTLDGTGSRIPFVHLKYPNGWSANDSIGKSFGYMHSDVFTSKGSLLMPKPELIVDMIINSPEPMERIGAISLRDNSCLNRHPLFYTPAKWDFNENPNIFMRFERQAIIPFKHKSAFLFIIQTFFVDLTKPEYADKFLKALDKSGPNIYFRHALEGDNKDKIINYLKGVIK